MDDLKNLENIFLLCLVPSKVDLQEVWPKYLEEIKLLQSQGMHIKNPKTQELVHHKVRLALVKADSPQRSEFLDHRSVTALLPCPRCGVLQKELWSALHHPGSSRHYPGIIEALIELKQSLAPNEFEKVADAFGFHGNFSFFRDLIFSVFNQVNCEPYHLILLGIVRTLFRWHS